MLQLIRRAKARKDYEVLAAAYYDNIAKCVSMTQRHDDTTYKHSPTPSFTPCVTTKIEVTDEPLADVIGRVCREGVRVCILNDGSYRSPTAGFMDGGKGWESEICAHSLLANVLGKTHDWYAENRKQVNGGLYANRALYTPNIPFFGANVPTEVDVLTCSAPDRKEARAGGASDEEYWKAVRERLDFVLDVAVGNLVDVMVVGEWGRNLAFTNHTFADLLAPKYDKAFPHVIFLTRKL